jgi:exopolysaccharide biosynthesis protein
VARDADTDGAASFRDLNPRTLLGLNARGTRAWLVVVDGRQKGYSMGMTLRQEADLMLAMGATRAINLDGGGSSALVLRDVAGAVRTVNKPSDAGGERPVANALGVVPTCR